MHGVSVIALNGWREYLDFYSLLLLLSCFAQICQVCSARTKIDYLWTSIAILFEPCAFGAIVGVLCVKERKIAEVSTVVDPMS